MDNDSSLDEIRQAAEALGISVSEDDLSSDLDIISDSVHDAFWNEMYHNEDFEDARTAADDILGSMLEDLPYVSDHLNDSEWDESEEYDTFRELVSNEIFDRAGIPLDEDEAADMLADRVEEDDEDESYDELE